MHAPNAAQSVPNAAYISVSVAGKSQPFYSLAQVQLCF